MESTAKKNNSRYVLIALLSLSTLCYTYPYLSSTFYNQFMEAFQLSNAQIGHLLTLFSLTATPGYLFGGLLALFVMWALLHAEGKFCSLLGVSVAGAAAHNIGQICAAVLWMKTAAVLTYLPYLLVMSVPLGLVTGLVCAVVLTHMKKIDLHA